MHSQKLYPSSINLMLVRKSLINDNAINFDGIEYEYMSNIEIYNDSVFTATHYNASYREFVSVDGVIYPIDGNIKGILQVDDLQYAVEIRNDHSVIVDLEDNKVVAISKDKDQMRLPLEILNGYPNLHFSFRN